MQVSRHWRLNKQRYNLVGASEMQGVKVFPPRELIEENTDGDHFSFAGVGQVYSFTIVYDAPDEFQHSGPYTIALIKLKEGPLVTAQLTDIAPEDVTIDMSVEVVTRKLRTDGPEGMIVYGYKFRPVLSG